MKAFLHSHLFFFFTITSIALTLNLTPLFLHMRHAPEERQFALIHNNAQDFFFYLALMNQGAHGNWLTTDPYTTEPHSASFIFSYFLLFGKIGSFFGIPHAVTYHAVRIVAGILFLGLCFYFLQKIHPYRAKQTFLFFLLASPFLRIVTQDGEKQIAPFFHWWTGMDPIRRVAFLPHHMIGGGVFIAAIFLFLSYLKTKSWRALLGILFSFPLLAYIHPILLFLFLAITPPVLLFHKEKKRMVPLAFVGILGGFFLFLAVQQTNAGFPWSQYKEWERALQFPIVSELPGAFGILLPIALLGTAAALKKHSPLDLLTVSWFFVPLLLLPFAPVLGISNVRFIQAIPYLPLAILATEGVSFVETVVTKRFAPIIRMTALGAVILFAIPTLTWSLKQQIDEFWPTFGNIYLDRELFPAFSFIKNTLPPHAIVLSTFYTGNYLPAFVPVRSFVGHFGYTRDVGRKNAATEEFFRGNLSEDEARNFLTIVGPAIVFQGPEEKILSPNRLYPTLLIPIYDTPSVVMYKRM